MFNLFRKKYEIKEDDKASKNIKEYLVDKFGEERGVKKSKVLIDGLNDVLKDIKTKKQFDDLMEYAIAERNETRQILADLRSHKKFLLDFIPRAIRNNRKCYSDLITYRTKNKEELSMMDINAMNQIDETEELLLKMLEEAKDKKVCLAQLRELKEKAEDSLLTFEYGMVIGMSIEDDHYEKYI